MIPKKAKEFVVAAIVLLILDSIFISINMGAYTDQVINVQRVIMTVKPIGVILSYAFIIVGLYFFILRQQRPIW